MDSLSRLMNPMFRFRLRTLLIAIALICASLSICVCRTHLHVLAAMVSNDDVAMNSTSTTLELTGASRALAWFGNESRPIFLNLLESPNQFAAAHVALTELTERPSCFSGNIDTAQFGQLKFNRLLCDLDSKKLAFPDLASQPPLKKWWDDYFPLAEAREDTVHGGIMFFGDLDLSFIDTAE